MMFSISLGLLDEKAAKTLLKKLKSEGLIVKLLPEKRYQTERTREWITPLQCLQTSAHDQR